MAVANAGHLAGASSWREPGAISAENVMHLNPIGMAGTNLMKEMTMRSSFCLAGLALVLFGSVVHAAEECPAKSRSMDDIIAVLNAAPSCDRAMKLFEACEYGASGDVQFGEVVEKKCEADFIGHLKPSRKLSYRRELRVCDRKYRNQSGTMYISFTAFCRAEVAQRYSQRALKAGGAGR
jgi:hypothetical protein